MSDEKPADSHALDYRRIPREAVESGRAYLIHARNGGVGVAVRRDGQLGYMLHREKFGRHYLFIEWDWDEGAPFGTALPLARIELDPPSDEEELLAWLAAREEEHREETSRAWEEVHPVMMAMRRRHHGEPAFAAMLHGLASGTHGSWLVVGETAHDLKTASYSLRSWKIDLQRIGALEILSPHDSNGGASEHGDGFTALATALLTPQYAGAAPRVTIVNTSASSFFDDDEWREVFARCESALSTLAAQPRGLVWLVREPLLRTLSEVAPRLCAQCVATVRLEPQTESFDLAGALADLPGWREPAPEMHPDDPRIAGGRYTIFRMKLAGQHALSGAQRALLAGDNARAHQLASEVCEQNGPGDVTRAEESRAHGVLAAVAWRARRFDEALESLRLGLAMSVAGDLEMAPWPPSDEPAERDEAWQRDARALLETLYRHVGYEQLADELHGENVI